MAHFHRAFGGEYLFYASHGPVAVERCPSQFKVGGVHCLVVGADVGSFGENGVGVVGAERAEHVEVEHISSGVSGNVGSVHRCGFVVGDEEVVVSYAFLVLVLVGVGKVHSVWLTIG